ncbi:glycosyltransferase family 4 protein [candidate division KSB1 bacterium]
MEKASYNILFLNWQDIKHPLGGGAEVYDHEILKRIVNKGHKVTHLSCGHPTLAKDEIIDGIRTVRTGNRALFNYYAPFTYRRLRSEEKFDIAIDAINKVPILSPLYIRNIPVAGLVHHLFKKAIFKEAPLPVALYVNSFERMIKYVYRKSPFIVISPSTKDDVIKSGIGEDKISIVDCSVDLDLYRTTDKPKGDAPLIGYLGRIKKYKSVDHLIKAFEIVKKTVTDSKLIIVGDGDNLDDLKELTASLKLEDSVEFTGFVSEEEKVSILQKCHVVVNPSVKEGWGLTVIEANACGTTTIAADVPGLRDSVKDGETGLLYPYGDIEKCAGHIINVLKDNDFRNKLTVNAVEWSKQFSWDSAADKMIDVIKETIQNYKI